MYSTSKKGTDCDYIMEIFAERLAVINLKTSDCWDTHATQ